MKKMTGWTDQWTGQAPPPEPSIIYLGYTEHRYGGGVRPGQEGESWPDHEDEDIEFSITHCGLSAAGMDWQREQVQLDFHVDVGDTVWVVVVRYGTGGTFGHTNGAWTLIGVYPDEASALAVEDSIRKDTYKGYKCWQGYFESLEDVDVSSWVVVA